MCRTRQGFPTPTAFRTSHSLVTGAKEKLAASFTLFLGCFLAGLSAGSLLGWGSGASEAGPGGTGTAAGTQQEPEPGAGVSVFIGISMLSSWFRILISGNTKK